MPRSVEASRKSDDQGIGSQGITSGLIRCGLRNRNTRNQRADRWTEDSQAAVKWQPSSNQMATLGARVRFRCEVQAAGYGALNTLWSSRMTSRRASERVALRSCAPQSSPARSDKCSRKVFCRRAAVGGITSIRNVCVFGAVEGQSARASPDDRAIIFHRVQLRGHPAPPSRSRICQPRRGEALEEGCEAENYALTPSTLAPALTLEVPIDSIAAAKFCAPIATRIEVCDDLASEGWTPRMDVLRGCVEAVRGTSCTVVSMIRSRDNGLPSSLDIAGFQATPRAIDCAMREIEHSAAAGAHSIAIGFLRGDGMIDIDACARIRDHAESMGLIVAFLRSVDLVPDRAQAMRDLAALRVQRVISAGVLGWDASVVSLDARLTTLHADVRVLQEESVRLQSRQVEMVPGGGVRASNAIQWLAVSPHLHASCRVDGVFSPPSFMALARAMPMI